MIRSVVSVATAGPYQKGLARLRAAVPLLSHKHTALDLWDGGIPRYSLPHSKVPYAFKAYALRDAAMRGAELLLWCDSSVVPVRSMEPLWERIERDGYWFSLNGWSNNEWTADSAYPDLFGDDWRRNSTWTADDAYAHLFGDHNYSLESARKINATIPHVVATAFGISAGHPAGKKFLSEYYRLASETQAFCGPWINTNHAEYQGPKVENFQRGPCGPPDVRGHRHDQTAASVLAWRLKMVLTAPPDVFSYPRADGSVDEKTILVADGSVNA